MDSPSLLTCCASSEWAVLGLQVSVAPYSAAAISSIMSVVETTPSGMRSLSSTHRRCSLLAARLRRTASSEDSGVHTYRNGVASAVGGRGAHVVQHSSDRLDRASHERVVEVFKTQ